MERGLLVDGSEDGSLGRLGGVEGGSEVELQALGDLVLELNLGAEEVGSGPGLSRVSSVRAALVLQVIIGEGPVPSETGNIGPSSDFLWSEFALAY